MMHGDLHVEIDLAQAWGELGSRISRVSVDPNSDALRELVIACGQLEQAAHDALAGVSDHRAHPLVARLHAMTDLTARAFHADWVRTFNLEGATRWQPPRTYLHGLQREARARVDSAKATLRIPSGFAREGLFPEQYCAATWAWITARRTQFTGAVLVIGIRSIGTTLSALVAATLDSAGLDCQRLTVRHSRHNLTFDRQALEGVGAIVVVDDGPGPTGASMAATAFALERAGVSRQAISFMPAHENGPGIAAAPEVRELWSAVPVFAVPVTQAIFHGRTLHEHLAEAMARTSGASAEPLPQGDWRKLAYLDVDDWQPSVDARLRYRVRTPHGAVALEFGGTAILHGRTLVAGALASAEQRAAAGYAAAPIGTVTGFLARPWIDGSALRARDIDASLLVTLAHYVSSMAGTSLDIPTLEDAQRRRAAWASRHLADALGDSAAQRAAAYVEAGSVIPSGWSREAFDYDLSPQHFMRTEGGLSRIAGPRRAPKYTDVGTQPVVWDVVSLLVEWRLGRADARALVTAVEHALGALLPRPALRAFMLAYIASRVGELTQQRDNVLDPEELQRFDTAIANYCKQVDPLLQ